MTTLKYLTILFFGFGFLCSNAQTWPRYYGEPNRKDESHDIAEAYDKGYFILGHYLSQNSVPKSTWLIKTDINGEILWEKIFVSGGFNKPFGMEPTEDGGVLICGLNWREGHNRSEPFIVKINACGDKEWCREFTESPIDNIPWASDVKETPSGDILVLVNEYGNHPINTMHLFKLNANGEVLWRNPYASADHHPGSINPSGNKLVITSNNDYLISGDIYWEDPWNPGGPMGIRPAFTLIDSVGNERWVLPFGVNDTIYGSCASVLEFKNNKFIAAGSYWPDQYVEPLFMKFNSVGIQLAYDILFSDEISPNSVGGSFSSMVFADSMNFCGGLFGFDSDLDVLILEAIMEYDTLNFIFDAQEINTHNNSKNPHNVDALSEYQVISSFSRNNDIRVSKMNLNLEYDTLDPGNYTYDSLCTTPGLPQSGFISLDDCDLFVDIDEIPNAKQYQEKIRWIPIKAFPNPVTEGKLTLEFENTKHHKNMQLQCYDDFGRQIHSQKIYKGQQDTDVDVSGWPPGIYIAVIYSDGSARGKAKFVVR